MKTMIILGVLLSAPISACFREGASFTPSPVIAAILPFARTASTRKEAPEVDGEVLIDPRSLSDPRSLIGTFADVEIVGADEYDLTAELI